MTYQRCIQYSKPEKFEYAPSFLRSGLPSTLIRHENGALFLRLVLPSTLIRHENVRGYSKSLLKPEELKNAGFSFSCRLKTFHEGKRSFTETMASRLSRDFSDRTFLKHKSKMAGDWCVIEFLRCSVDDLMHFRVKPPFSNSFGVVWTPHALNLRDRLRFFLFFFALCRLTPYRPSQNRTGSFVVADVEYFN